MLPKPGKPWSLTIRAHYLMIIYTDENIPSNQIITFAFVKTHTILDIVPLSSWLKSSAMPLLLAGPCSAESEEQVMATAEGLSKIEQMTVFRAGIWKPRSRPSGFSGAGEQGLKWMAQVKKTYGLPVIIEVATPEHVELAEKYDVDMYWIGARTVVNPFSVEAVAQALKGIDKPVLVKNPVNPDVQLWIGAMERLNQAGIKKIAAVHRGFTGFFKTHYRNAPMWEIPIELKRLFPELPVICDPSHIAGHTILLAEISQKALDLQMDGLMIESHISPKQALTDAHQQIEPNRLQELINRLVIRSGNVSPDYKNTLESLRLEIDKIDNELLHILARRMAIVGEIGKFKKENNVTILQIQRWRSMLRNRIAQGLEHGLNKAFLKQLLDFVHQESIRLQNEIMNRKDPSS
jgi:chorismate mutase